uniref:SCAN box domain-containing protein n=1 Tax=Chelonoidis abingdonii TaxID=106734 RepID=A0A8C0J6G5_CHEAB
ESGEPCSWLAPYLAGETQAAYMALGEEQARNYEVVKSAFTPKLIDWATRWLRPDTQIVGEIMEVLVLEQFLQGLLENIKVWVRRHQPNTVEAAVMLMEEYTEADFPRKEGQPSKEAKTGRRLKEPPPRKGPENKWEDIEALSFQERAGTNPEPLKESKGGKTGKHSRGCE